MAREAYRSLYGDLAKLKDDSLLKDPAAGTGDDNEMFQLLLSVSDWVDRYCNRYFYPRTQTLEFDGSGASRLFIPDLISLNALKEDTTDDKTFDTTMGWEIQNALTVAKIVATAALARTKSIGVHFRDDTPPDHNV